MEINEITGIVLNACIKIHTEIGLGCFEKVNEETLSHELLKRKLYIERQLLLPISYEEMFVEDAY
jgi:GxxExxY protein